jgi:hypothetical protein
MNHDGEVPPTLRLDDYGLSGVALVQNQLEAISYDS